jgi:hypothetical protein
MVTDLFIAGNVIRNINQKDFSKNLNFFINNPFFTKKSFIFLHKTKDLG